MFTVPVSDLTGSNAAEILEFVGGKKTHDRKCLNIRFRRTIDVPGWDFSCSARRLCHEEFICIHLLIVGAPGWGPEQMRWPLWSSTESV